MRSSAMAPAGAPETAGGNGERPGCSGRRRPPRVLATSDDHFVRGNVLANGPNRMLAHVTADSFVSNRSDLAASRAVSRASLLRWGRHAGARDTIEPAGTWFSSSCNHQGRSPPPKG
jgi:hypothetical protein